VLETLIRSRTQFFVIIFNKFNENIKKSTLKNIILAFILGVLVNARLRNQPNPFELMVLLVLYTDYNCLARVTFMTKMQPLIYSFDYIISYHRLLKDP